MCKFHRNNDSCLKKVIQHGELQNTKLYKTQEFMAHALNYLCASFVIVISIVTRPAFDTCTCFLKLTFIILYSMSFQIS